VPRQFVMLLTTNDETPLKDRTGNRRFLPVRAGQIDLAALQRDRDQLWAEAYKRAKDGEPAVLPSSVWAEARAVQSASVELDPITERLTEVLEGLSGRVLKEDLWLAVGRHHAANRTQREKNSLTAAMREQGWKAERHRYKKGRKRECYAKGSDRWLDWDAGDAKFA
jgi:predicted P-loop ATPase